MDEYKHYIRLNEAGIVVHGFSSAFEEPLEGDIEIPGEHGRHFQLQLTDARGQFIYTIVNGAMVARTQAELDVEWNSRPAPPKTELELVKAENAQLTTQIIDLWETLISLGVV